MRIGIGHDIHRLKEGRKLFLGGLEIPSKKGALGHSDGDVLLHAICDALLGASGLGDIGTHFPDTACEYKDAASRLFLERTNALLKRKGYAINNIDAVIITELVRLEPYKKKIQENIAEILKVPGSLINIKAKTSEGLGDIGSGEAITSYAAAAIKEE